MFTDSNFEEAHERILVSRVSETEGHRLGLGARAECMQGERLNDVAHVRTLLLLHVFRARIPMFRL